MKEFVNLMNEEAIRLGLISTVFKNPHGLSNAYNVTSCHDLSILINEAFKY